MPEYIEYTARIKVTPCKRCGTTDDKAALERYCQACQDWCHEQGLVPCDACGTYVPENELGIYGFGDACQECRGEPT